MAQMRFALITGITAFILVAAVGMYVTDFTAYLGNNPATCNNCHVMDTVYESWFHASHQAWAECNDCHTPHALVPKYITKAVSGYHHVTAFVFGDIPEAIRAKQDSLEVVQENCIRCHTESVALTFEVDHISNRYCFECHRFVAHGERGVSLLPYQDQ
jgi:cytochrome c nitrite reductase small subunit